MAKSNKELVKQLTHLREEHRELVESFNFHQMENFNYALKCHRVENVISRIEAILKNTPAKMLQASDNLYKILSTCRSLHTEFDTNATSNETVKTPNAHDSKTISKTPSVSDSKSKNPKCNKVQPHMVNGHILFAPTINLTRVSNTSILSNDLNTLQVSQHDSPKQNPGTSSSLTLRDSQEDDSFRNVAQASSSVYPMSSRETFENSEGESEASIPTDFTTTNDSERLDLSEASTSRSSPFSASFQNVEANQINVEESPRLDLSYSKVSLRRNKNRNKPQLTYVNKRKRQ